MPKSVLVIDAIATHRIRFAALLESARYAVTTVSSIGEYVGDPKQHDLVLLGLSDEQPASSVASTLSALQGASVPILCLDTKGAPLRRLLALKAGARDVLPSKSPDDLLLARVRGLIREVDADREASRRQAAAAKFGLAEAPSGFAARARVVCVGDLGALPSNLAVLSTHDVSCLGAEECLGAGTEELEADAVLINAALGQQWLSKLIPDLRDRYNLRVAPVMAVYPQRFPNLATHALALGASEAVTDKASVEEVALRINAMVERRRRIEAVRRVAEDSYELAMTDPLTGLFNRRFAETYLSNMSTRAADAPIGYCLLLVDLDHFKAVNDTHGHAAGDQVLRAVARRLEANLRTEDLVARFGGEEFMIILPDTTPETARVLAERLRKEVASAPIAVRDAVEISVTVSIGVAPGIVERQMAGQRTGTFDTQIGFGSEPFLSVFEAADAALYSAKSNGRDRVELSDACRP